jgi:PKD repeat protein
VPVRVVEPQFNESLWGGISAIPAFSNALWMLKIYPDFANIAPNGIVATPIVDNYRYFLDLGDGTVTTDLTAEHYYKYPGEYTVTLVVVDSATNFYKGLQQPVIKVNDVISDSIFLTYNLTAADVDVDGTPVDGGKITAQSTFQNPLRITRYNSYQTYPSLSSTGYSINLTVSGNRSELVSPSGYYSDPEAHLKKYAAFVQMQEDGQGLVVDKIKTTNDKMYGQLNVVAEDLPPYFLSPTSKSNNIFVGTSGVGTFYYYED